jgi:hypothetical protein
MPEYRRLSSVELQELRKEFIEYLVLNGITAEEWDQMKQNDLPKAEKIIELFSDVVFESILRKISFLEYRDKTTLRLFQCLSEKLVVVAMEAPKESNVDFTDNSYLNKAAHHPPEALKIYTSEKKYSRKRETELFEMLQTGCVITDDKLFKTLCLSLPL